MDIVRDGSWQWFDIEGVQCADGRQSGVGVRAVEDSAGLVVYFKGGGACFNSTSCGLSAPLMLTGFEAIEENPEGVLDFEATDNPLANHDIVYFPYCTGDVHGGTAPQTMVAGVGDPWDFVGHDNVVRALDRVGPTFADASRLLVLGTSAGGIGALVNFPRIVEGWPGAETFLLDDSGMIFRDDYLAPCLQRQMRDTWSLANVLPDDCPDCETEDGGGMAQYFAYLGERYPQTHFGVVGSTRDQIVRIFFGFGNDACEPGPGLPDLGEQVLTEALADLRSTVLADRYATFVVDSDQHTWTTTPQFYTAEAGGVPLSTWFQAFLAGDATDVGP
ncbi:MAG: hypothetical protein K0V04_11705 [Deltaproteobacteria bacterium]|nr:hypothetical protein [Deltaproteobacteria bacterium]